MPGDEIPEVDDAAAADRALRAGRADTTVVISANLLVPGPEAEMEVTTMANGGLRAEVIGHRQALPHERGAPGWRGAWDGDTSKITLGRPWWWRQRTVGGVGSHQDLLDAQFGPYEDAMRAARSA